MFGPPNTLVFDEYRCAYWREGAGDTVILLHGSGPGASSNGTWSLQFAALAGSFDVIAMDWIGYGASSPKVTAPYFDTDLWERQLQFVIEALTRGRVSIVCHSMSFPIAVRLTNKIPSIGKIVGIASMGRMKRANMHLRKAWTFPESLEGLKQTMDSLVFHRSSLPDEVLEKRLESLSAAEYREYFSKLFGSDLDATVERTVLNSDVDCNTDILLIHGLNDLPIPFEENAIPLALRYKADLILLSNCGHLPTIERPNDVLRIIGGFLGQAPDVA